MFTACLHHRLQPAWRAASRTVLSVALLAGSLLIPRTAFAQTAQSLPRATASAPVAATMPANAPDLQGLWDFEMRAGDRTSPGFFALGPVEQGWAGSITMYLTNTLAIRSLTVTGDSVRMVVASREGDVRFLARLVNSGRTMTGIVEYHGGALLPMTATLRPRPTTTR